MMPCAEAHLRAVQVQRAGDGMIEVRGGDAEKTTGLTGVVASPLTRLTVTVDAMSDPFES